MVKACEGLMLISSVAHITCTKALIKHSKFCETLTQLLVTHYNNIPDILDPADVEHIYVAWGFVRLFGCIFYRYFYHLLPDYEGHKQVIITLRVNKCW